MLQSFRRSLIALFAAFTALGFHGSAGAVDQLLRITEVMSKPSDRFSAPDWFELTNFGGGTIDLTLFAVDDNSFSLGASAFLNSVDVNPIVIKPGESVVFVEGDSASVAAFRLNWNLDSTVQVGYYGGSGLSFSSGGDGTTVFDNTDTELPGPFGGLIRVSYPAATTGRSFFWNYAADGSLGSASAGTVTPTTDEDPFSMNWTYTLTDGVTAETQFATPGKAVIAAEGIGILRWAGPAGDGGSGNWISASPLNWRDGAAAVAWDASSIATFPATNPTVGTVTLTESVAAAELDFGKSGYTIAASSAAHTLTLNSGIINVASGVTTTINATLDGPVGLAKTGPGLLLLGSPNNQYDGLTSVAFGTLRLTGSGALPATSVLSVGLTGIADLNNRSTTVGGLQGLGDVLLGSGTLTISITDDTDREHNGNLSGQGDVIIDSSGSGEQSFDLRTSTASKSKSYSGKTIVREGTLRVSFESAPTATSGIEIEEGGRLKLSSSTTTGNYFFGLNGNSDVTTAVTMLGGTLTNSEGEVTQLDNDVVISGTVASRIEVNEENNPTPENPNAARLILAGALRGSGTSHVVGNGTVTAGADLGEYSGAESDFSGRLLVGDAAAAGKTTLLDLAGSVGTGTVVVNGNGAVQAVAGVPFAARTVELAGGEMRLNAEAGSATTFNQTAVSVTADSTLAVRRAADVETTLAPAYDLPLTFSGGGLSITAATAAGTDATAFTAAPTFTGAITLAQPATVTVVNPANGTNHATFGAAIGDGGAGRGLTKAGAGRLTLAAANTYAGATTISTGTLALAAAGSIAASPLVSVAADARFDVTAKVGGYSVAAGQTLAGAGTVAGSVSVGTDATLAPGMSPGTLTVTENVSWGSGGSYNWQVHDFGSTAGAVGGWDLLSIGGTLDVSATTGSPFAINLWSLSGTGPDVSGAALGWNATQSGSWRIASAAGGITGFSADKFTVSTTAANNTAGFANTLSGGTFSMIQDNNDILLRFTAGSGPPPSEIVIDVPSGSVSQADAGHPLLSGTTPVRKTGDGTLVLSAMNTNTGETFVDEGVVTVLGTTGSGTITVESGAAVGGTGTIAGTLVLRPGSRLRLGLAAAAAEQQGIGLTSSYFEGDSLLGLESNQAARSALALTSTIDESDQQSLYPASGSFSPGSGASLDSISGASTPSIAAVPEPTSGILAALGLCAAAWALRRRLART